jgi:pyruvate,orthophosphate dikinase
MTLEKSRAVNPKIRFGVCGEQGGEPNSVHFFHSAGLDYVSCSPFRVPIARIAAAQVGLIQAGKVLWYFIFQPLNGGIHYC